MSQAKPIHADLAPFSVRGTVALVTGANRGIGKAFTQALAARGAAKVYGGARKPESVTVDGVVPLRLDVTDPDQVAAAVQTGGDITLLINNAGIFRRSFLIGEPTMRDARDEMEVDFFGRLAMIKAFAPVLARNGGGAIVNCLSELSFINYAPWGAHSAAKAAAWSLTNSARDELAGQGTRVLGVHAGLVDTEMIAGMDYPKISPQSFVDAALDALESGHIEALVDQHTRDYKSNLGDYPNNQASNIRWYNLPAVTTAVGPLPASYLPLQPGELPISIMARRLAIHAGKSASAWTARRLPFRRGRTKS